MRSHSPQPPNSTSLCFLRPSLRVELVPVGDAPDLLAVLTGELAALYEIEYLLDKLFIITIFDTFYPAEQVYLIKAEFDVTVALLAKLRLHPEENLPQELFLKVVQQSFELAYRIIFLVFVS